MLMLFRSKSFKIIEPANKKKFQGQLFPAVWISTYRWTLRPAAARAGTFSAALKIATKTNENWGESYEQ